MGAYTLAGKTLQAALAGGIPPAVASEAISLDISLSGIDVEAADLIGPAVVRIQIDKALEAAKSNYLKEELREIAGNKDYASVVKFLKS